MRKIIEIENIEELRRQVGIEDEELRDAIGKLRTGDIVNVTLTSSRARLIAVRITRIRGPEFRARPLGKLSSKVVTFKAAHIHSVARGHRQKTLEQ